MAEKINTTCGQKFSCWRCSFREGEVGDFAYQIVKGKNRGM